jgi:hypothetical protein
VVRDGLQRRASPSGTDWICAVVAGRRASSTWCLGALDPPPRCAHLVPPSPDLRALVADGRAATVVVAEARRTAEGYFSRQQRRRNVVAWRRQVRGGVVDPRRALGLGAPPRWAVLAPQGPGLHTPAAEHLVAARRFVAGGAALVRRRWRRLW